MSDKVEAIRLKEEGNTAFQEKRYKDALVSYTEAIKVDRNNASLWGNRSTTYFNLGLMDKCVEDAAYAIELSPKTAKYYWRKGMAHLQLGQNYAAKLAFQNGLRQEPGNDQLRSALAERKAGEPAYVGRLASLSWEQKRDKATELKAEGNKFFTSKSFGPAIAKYTEAIEYDPTDPVFYTNRAACYTEIGKFDEAIADCELAVVLGKTNGVNCLGQTSFLEPRLLAKAYMRLGIASEKKGEIAKAEQAYKDGIAVESSQQLRDMLEKLKSKK
ncbi:putative Stress-induced-phosphoprotein 1 [Monocercomonoides exilis]|uniref:putative Stress-induced-phosphoprotein 1 n=1 Tax=Monocercomonoides exilis TaxID=2049356 RepID=UPI00355A5F63|nr:putative Stress-induced-phosphoprotein 1 [Monocercomonoides exilis]|eukprot:MONOS_6493.1-p1 / transcript=MONOS_6493.1 / gene=MONOS_6493 / organism=Monocercomonoides_exilis_PA203 / gene_product=Stress-induced-phosphoprotein 1 / transcript_product=Stress-induced-phosphoprotein 1 / location=Mono_scaffold00205:57033-57848(-) / protein_length=272 / sequence_SO=supercontig / SO=protein_coding / is_pseudo=false